MIEEEVKRRRNHLTLPDDGNDLNHYIDRYDGGIRYTDDRIAEFLTALEARGLRERTVLIVASDHGDEFLDHGGWEHGGRVYEELVHVPLIFVWPGSENRVEDRPVSTLSIFATLAGILGVEPPENDGVDLGPLLRGDGEVALPGFVLSQTGQSRPPFRDAVRHRDWKLVTDEAGRRIALYDLAVDPDERSDRSPNEGDRAEQLAEGRGALGLAVAPGTVSSRPADEVDDDLRERLRALGYSE